MRGLDTDLALGLEIKSLTMTTAGHNAFLPHHALLDSFILPLFATGAMATEGRLDLGARIVPSEKVRYTVQVDLNFISLKAGGHFFKKTYVIRLDEPAVAESGPTADDPETDHAADEAGGLETERLLEILFAWMVRDPEISHIPRLARVVWLGRVFEDPGIPATQRAQLMEGVLDEVDIPAWSARELKILGDPFLSVSAKIKRLEKQGLSPTDELRRAAENVELVEEEKARLKVFERTRTLVTNEAARLRLLLRTRPLSPAESDLLARLKGRLEAWAERRIPNLLFQQTLLDDSTDAAVRQTLAGIIARGSDGFGKQEFPDRLIGLCLERLRGSGEKERIDAAALLIALAGEKAPDRFSIPRMLLYNALSGNETWAAPLILEALGEDTPGVEVIRLAGALGLEEAVPVLIRILRRKSDNRTPPAFKNRAEIPLLPSGSAAQTEAIGTRHRVAAARALGAFDDKKSFQALEEFLEDWSTGDRREPETAAEAILSLARLTGPNGAHRFFALWENNLAATGPAVQVRRAALDSIEKSDDSETWNQVLDRTRTEFDLAAAEQGGLDNSELKWTAVREAFDFFGRVGHAPSVDLLARALALSSIPDRVGNSALEALARLGTPQAEEAIEVATTTVSRDRKYSALKALDKLAANRAFRTEINRRLKHD